MRRYNIVYRVLLILSVINFAFAAPVLVQEKRQASDDVVHIPDGAINVWGKRVDELDLMWEGYLKMWGKPKELSAAPPPSGSPPSGPDHGPTNVVEAPVPLAWAPPASDSPGAHAVRPMEAYRPAADPWSFTKTGHKSPGLLYTPASSELGPDDGLMLTLGPPNPANQKPSTQPELGSVDDLMPVVTHAPQLNPASRKRPWTEIGSDDDLKLTLSPPNPAKKPSTEPFDWSHWMSVVNPPPAHEYQVEHPPSHPGLPTDGSQMELPPSQGAGSPTGFISLDDLGHEPESQMPHSLWQAAGPRTAPGNGLLYAPPPSPEASTNPDLQMMNAEYQLNPQAVTYGLKGKSKVPGQEDQPGSSNPSGA